MAKRSAQSRPRAQELSRPAPDAGRPVALVTGVARRVGRAIALELAAAGCDIVGTYRSSRREAGSLGGELGARGASLRLETLDLADAGAVGALAAELAGSLARLDVLVHNASEYTPSRIPLTAGRRGSAGGALAALGADAGRLYAVNALAPLVMSAALAPLLERSGGSIVAIADMHALGRPRRGFAAYSMSKAALVEMVRSLARDLAPGVRVNGVAPGVVAWPESGPESERAMQEAYLKRVPLGRAGTPEECARAVRWLALEAGYVTGEILRLDGGRWLA